MNVSRKDINVMKTGLYNQIKGSTIHMPKWQRTYDWKPENAHDMINEIIYCASKPDMVREENASYLGNAIVYRDVANNKLMVADGHSRMVTFSLILRALVDLCTEKGFAIGAPQSFQVVYEFEEAKKEYATFNRNPSGCTTYAQVYQYAYEKLSKYVLNEKRAVAVVDVMTNFVDITIEEYASISLAHKAFVQHNTGSAPLTKIEIISSFLQFYMEEYSIELDYEYKELATLLEGYYYWKASGNLAPVFSPGVIKDFMTNYVVNSEANMLQLGEFFDNVNAFKGCAWYRLAKTLDTKTIPVAYLLAGKGYDVTGGDDAVNRLMTSIFVFEISCFARKANSGGSVSSYFDEIKKMIGCGMDIDAIDKAFRTWAEENQHNYGDDFANFSKNLDNLVDAKKKAILWFAYMDKNHNSLPVNVEEEHSFPIDHEIAWWKTSNWPKSKKDREKMLHSLGNMFLLDKVTNKKAGNNSIETKGMLYEEFFNSNAAYKFSLNYFDATRFANEKQSYLDERRDAYARLLADTPMGKVLIK